MTIKTRDRLSQVTKGARTMSDYEGAILSRQESEKELCRHCEHKGSACNNQCMEIEFHFNPNIPVDLIRKGE